MAKKQSASILTRLQKLIKPASEKPAAPRGNAMRPEKRQPAESPTDAATAETKAQGTPEHDKKQTTKQPWYRHRQRW